MNGLVALIIMLVTAPMHLDAAVAPTLDENQGSWDARAGELYILQLWSTDQERFLQQWSQPTPPTLTTDSLVGRNQPVHQFIIFGGCQSDAMGNCNLRGEVIITDPEGARYGEVLTFALWDNQPGPPADHLSLAPGGIGLVIEAGETLGTYSAQLSITDLNAGVTAVSTAEIRFEEAGA